MSVAVNVALAVLLAPAPAGVQPSPAASPPPPKTRDEMIGVGLVAGGGALMLGGAGLLISAETGRRAGSSSSNTEDAYDLRVRRLARVHYAGITVAALGVAVLVTGGIYWGLAAKRKKRATARRLRFGVGSIACAF